MDGYLWLTPLLLLPVLFLWRLSGCLLSRSGTGPGAGAPIDSPPVCPAAGTTAPADLVRFVVILPHGGAPKTDFVLVALWNSDDGSVSGSARLGVNAVDAAFPAGDADRFGWRIAVCLPHGTYTVTATVTQGGAVVRTGTCNGTLSGPGTRVRFASVVGTPEPDFVIQACFEPGP